jgi:hypothetical protein
MPNRTKLEEQRNAVYPLSPSSLENIDQAMHDYINNELNIFCETNEGSKKVKVKFVGTERAFDIKDDPTLRSVNGRTLEYPLISVSRDSIVSNPQNKGRYGVHVPPYFDYYNQGGAVEIARVVEQDKTKNFANANAIRRSASKKSLNRQTFPGENKNIVYETISIPMPSFIEVQYTISAITNYQQQLNDIVTPFITRTGNPSVFKIKNEGHSYEAFFEKSFSLDGNQNNLGTSERVFSANFTVKVLGHLIGADKNNETPSVIKTQSAAKITMQRERVIVGDVPDFHKDIKSKYRP